LFCLFKIIFPLCSSKIQICFNFAWWSSVSGQGDKDGEVIGAEGSDGVPGEGGGKVGGAEGEVRRGGLAKGGNTGGGVLVEEAEVAAV